MTKWSQTRRQKLKQTYGCGHDLYVNVDSDGHLAIQIQGKGVWFFLDPDEVQDILNESKTEEQKSPVTDIESEVRMIKQEIDKMNSITVWMVVPKDVNNKVLEPRVFTEPLDAMEHAVRFGCGVVITKNELLVSDENLVLAPAPIYKETK